MDRATIDRIMNETLAGQGMTRPRTDQTGGVDPSALARIIDHTLLEAEAPITDVERLCAEAVTYGFATVCVNPCHVALCARILRGSSVRVCTVVGFPLGASTAAAKAFEAEEAIRAGAQEIDMVMNIGLLKSGRHDDVEREIAAVTTIARKHGVLTKVILETALLTDDEKEAACTLAQRAAADFVKTSTGFSKGGATVSDVALMRRVVGDTMGIKASGGIRTRGEALAMVAAGANRIGTSAGVTIVGRTIHKPTQVP